MIILYYYFAQIFHGQVNGQVICFFARSFDLAWPGVAPPLHKAVYQAYFFASDSAIFIYSWTEHLWFNSMNNEHWRVTNVWYYYLGFHKEGPFFLWLLMLSQRGPNHVFLFFSICSKLIFFRGAFAQCSLLLYTSLHTECAVAHRGVCCCTLGVLLHTRCASCFDRFWLVFNGVTCHVAHIEFDIKGLMELL